MKLSAVSASAWLTARWLTWRSAVLDNRRGLAIAVGLFAAAAFAFRQLRRAAAFWTIDDAAITYSASFELADHGSLAPYLEGTPIESYSNPLVFFVVAALRKLHLFDPIATHLYIEGALFAVMVVLAWVIVREVAGDLAAVAGAVAFGAVELLTPATWVWYGSGLENVWVATGIVALVWICARTSRGVPLSPAWGAVAFLVALTRPESPVYVAAFYFALLAFARPAELPRIAHARRVAYALAVTVALYAGFLLWRRLAYSAWLPNTYYAKLPGKPHLGDRFRAYVLPELLPYYRTALFAGCAFALMMIRKTERLGLALFAMLVATLALPILADADWMGNERFGTPFFAVSHLAYGALVACCIAQLTQTPWRSWRVAPIVTVVCVLSVGALHKCDGAKAHTPVLNPVTVGVVADGDGAVRWEHQMRLGVPFAVVLDPDIGGALLVGSMQLVDNGFLADYQTPRIGRNPAVLADVRVMDQYEYAERAPDIVNDNPMWELDRSVLVARYVEGSDRLWAQRELVEGAVPRDAQLLLSDGPVSVFLSPNSVLVGAPGSLVRVEVYVVWSGRIDGSTRLRAAVQGGDRDMLALQAYAPAETGSERRGLLLGVPRKPGHYTLSISLEHNGQPPLPGRPLAIDVVSDPAAIGQTAAQLASAASPLDAARRVAWLREQQRPRLGMTEFHLFLSDLRAYDRMRSYRLGAVLLLLRRNAELAALHDLPDGLRTAEATAIRRVVGTCAAPGATDESQASRELCLGRAVDQLRRLGYLGVLDRYPALADELARLRAASARWPAAQHYRALVGYTLAKPSDVSAQRELLQARTAATTNLSYPAL